MIYENILAVRQPTPMVKLHRVSRSVKAAIAAKLEMFTAGGSVKDRIAGPMIETLEKDGRLKPGGVIVEATSGNTGVGLAMLAALKGYKVIFTITDKQSREKIDLLKAYGAEVVVCPTAVAPEDPRSYYSVAKRLQQEIAGSVYPNQYENPDNPRAHYERTGPEIWEQTEGKIDIFVCGLGTGGTISGAGRYLKEKNPSVRVIGVDPVGSLYYDYFHTGKVVQAHTYKVEGIGEDFFPKTMDFSVLDDVIQVTDKESFLMTRRLAREEGILGGGSSGAAVSGALRFARDLDDKQLVVVLLPDSGNRNLSKVYNDEWMRENRFLEPPLRVTAEDILRRKEKTVRQLVSAHRATSALEALNQMKKFEVSQIPVVEDHQIVGSLHEDQILETLMLGKDLSKVLVGEVMGAPLPTVSKHAQLDEISALFAPRVSAVLVELAQGEFGIITKYDLLRLITGREGA